MSRIREIRERLKLTQTELASELGCTQGNIGFLERGKQRLRSDRAEKLIALASRKGLRLTLDQVYGLKPLPGEKARA